MFKNILEDSDTGRQETSENVDVDVSVDYSKKKEKIQVKDLDSNQDGKMGHEMRTVTEMKDAARRLTKSEMLSHKRSPGVGE